MNVGERPVRRRGRDKRGCRDERGQGMRVNKYTVNQNINRIYCVPE